MPGADKPIAPATETPARTPTPANRFGVDYAEEGARLGAPVRPIIDAHAHINGARASAIWKRAADDYGVVKVYSQTQLKEADAVRGVLGDAVEFIAIPEYMSEDRQKSFTTGFVENLGVWAEEFGARCVKHWAAPRMWDIATEFDDPYAVAAIDGAWRRRVADRAAELGMMMMAHIADPDTWFATRYADAGVYGSKDEQYDRLERMLEAYDMPWLIAHMMGSPEDLGRIATLMDRYPKVVLDTSATKWMVRELSKHDGDAFVAFFRRFEGRILFGSDIVTSDEHLTPSDPDSPRFGVQLASSEGEAYDLYASRYWALRTMFETDYRGESNIADPDLAMVDPANHDAMSAPALTGRSLPGDMLDVLYGGAAESTMQAWFDARRD
jgi:hypothetical protein